MSQTMVERKKDPSVETLRGAAIILVVMGHVIGSASDGGMQVRDDSFLRHVYFTFQYLRMPLFTVISGWVYALHPASFGSLKVFMTKKIRRVLIPMVVVGACYFLLQYFTPGTNKKGNLGDIWQLLVFPYTLYWFLFSLFLVFSLIAILDSLKWIFEFKPWLVSFLLALSLLIFRDSLIPEAWPNYFSYKGAIYLLPFFLLGIGIKRFDKVFSNRYLLIPLFIILIISLIVQQLTWYDLVDYSFSKRGGLGLIIGLTGMVLIFRVRMNVGWLIWIGSFAYTIYLFHAFGTAGGRIITKAIGIHNTAVIFFISLLAGMFVPIITEFLLDKFSLTRMIFLGRSYHKSKKNEQG